MNPTNHRRHPNRSIGEARCSRFQGASLPTTPLAISHRRLDRLFPALPEGEPTGPWPHGGSERANWSMDVYCGRLSQGTGAAGRSRLGLAFHTYEPMARAPVAIAARTAWVIPATQERHGTRADKGWTLLHSFAEDCEVRIRARDSEKRTSRYPSSVPTAITPNPDRSPTPIGGRRPVVPFP